MPILNIHFLYCHSEKKHPKSLNHLHFQTSKVEDIEVWVLMHRVGPKKIHGTKTWIGSMSTTLKLETSIFLRCPIWSLEMSAMDFYTEKPLRPLEPTKRDKFFVRLNSAQPLMEMLGLFFARISFPLALWSKSQSWSCALRWRKKREMKHQDSERRPCQPGIKICRFANFYGNKFSQIL